MSASAMQGAIIMQKIKTKNGDAKKKRSGREVHGVSPEAGRESMMHGKGL